MCDGTAAAAAIAGPEAVVAARLFYDYYFSLSLILQRVLYNGTDVSWAPPSIQVTSSFSSQYGVRRFSLFFLSYFHLIFALYHAVYIK